MGSGTRTTAKFRVLLAKAGLDGHNRGVHVIAQGLVQAGFDVIYLGMRSTPEAIAATAAEEDVDCVGISILSGAHRTILPKLRVLLDERGCAAIPLVAGGIISTADATWLKRQGVQDVYGPGTSLKEVTDAVDALCRNRRSAFGMPTPAERSGGRIDQIR